MAMATAYLEQLRFFVRHLHCHIYHTMAQSLLLVVARLAWLNVSV